MKVSKWNVKIKKAFSKLKDKQIKEAALKLQKANFEVVEKFKKSDAYFDKLCDYYVEGFKLFRKYMAKHHPGLDFILLKWRQLRRRF